jgi:hypothetical protein
MPLKELEINEKDKTYITVVESLPDYENDPVFIKKREEAIKFLTEVPLPDAILDRIEGPSILKKPKN